jgi:hypothetical protein
MRHDVDVQVIARICQAGEQRAEDGAVDEELGDRRIGEAGCYHGGKKREERGKGEGIRSVRMGCFGRGVVEVWLRGMGRLVGGFGSATVGCGVLGTCIAACRYC